MNRKSANEGTWGWGWAPWFHTRPSCQDLHVKIWCKVQAQKEFSEAGFLFVFYFMCMGVSLEEVRTECPIPWNWSYRLL